MPSVQWGATATSHFVWTPISAALANFPNGAGTTAILWKPTSASSVDGTALTDSGNPSPTNWYHGANVTTGLWYDDDGTNIITPSNGQNATDWFIEVVDHPSGAAALERFHSVDMTTAAAWVHSNSTGNNSGTRAGPGTSGWLRVGYNGDNGDAIGTQIALVAYWAGITLGDTNAALLNANKKTSDWYNNPAGVPDFLAEITSLTPTDLVSGNGFSSANSITTNLSVGGDPAGGWNFDGKGVVADNTTKPGLLGMFSSQLVPNGWF